MSLLHSKETSYPVVFSDKNGCPYKSNTGSRQCILASLMKYYHIFNDLWEIFEQICKVYLLPVSDRLSSNP